MDVIRRYWITGLAGALGVFLLFLALAIGLDDEPTSWQERVFGVFMTGVPGLVLFGGLWSLHTSRLTTPLSLGAIVVGVAGALIWFWMLIPPVVAIAVLWFGVFRGGLARELRTA